MMAEDAARSARPAGPERRGRRGPAIGPRIAAFAAALALAGCAARLSAPTDDACALPTVAPAAVPALDGMAGAPERASGYTPKRLHRARDFVAVTANPHASRAACEVLRDGGSAVDAAIAAQMVLNVVEPQSSGLGGGGFLLHWDARRRQIVAWDGRETAPAASRPDDLRWISSDDRRAPLPTPRESGRSVGTPGLVAMLAAAHAEHGSVAWQDLFVPAIALAEGGFAVSPRLSLSIAGARDMLARDPLARAHLLDAAGQPPASGTRLTNPALAQTLRAIAEGGAAGFYGGPIARQIVDAALDTRGGTATAGRLTSADLAGYRPLRREPLCVAYRGHQVCGMPPPSSGGLAVAQVLGMLEGVDLSRLPPTGPRDEGGRPDPEAVHVVSDSLRLAFADRDRYVADPDFVPLPGTRDGGPAALLAPEYLRRRAALVDPARSLGTAAAGEFDAPPGADDPAAPRGGTTHLTIVDRAGNVVVMTTSIEAAFGSGRMTRGGFLLNNQLTDFAAAPADREGRPVANRLAPGKRPRSSMAPTLVLRPGADGRPAEFVAGTGSPGGAAIIHYVTKSLVGVLDWGLDAQQAASLISFGAFNGPVTFVGGEHPLIDRRDDGLGDPLVAGLRARGHAVRLDAQASGLAVVVRRCDAAGCVLEAGADPRREGVALGR